MTTHVYLLTADQRKQGARQILYKELQKLDPARLSMHIRQDCSFHDLRSIEQEIDTLLASIRNLVISS